MRSTGQLLLLDVPPAAGGPARLPRARSTPRVPVASLTLPFEGPSRRVEELVAARLARPSKVRPADLPPEERVFLLPRRLEETDRQELLGALEQTLGATRRRRGLLAREGGDTLELHLERELLRVILAGPSARARWLEPLLALTRERGLIEPE